MGNTNVSNKKSEQVGKFIDSKLLPPESLNDPDYRLKQLQKIFGGGSTIGCSKCHHCR